MRVLVSLKAGVLVSQGTNHESGWKTWNITGYDASVVTPPTVTFTSRLVGQYSIYDDVSISQDAELNFEECEWKTVRSTVASELTVSEWDALDVYSSGSIDGYEFSICEMQSGGCYVVVKLVDILGNVYIYGSPNRNGTAGGMD